MPDISAVELTAGLAGTVTVGTLIFLLMQNVKGVWPNLSGRDAELAVMGVALVAVFLAFTLAGTNWFDPIVYAYLFVAWLSATVTARGIYAQLFKVAVVNMPPPLGTEVAIDTTQRTDEHPVIRRSEPP